MDHLASAARDLLGLALTPAQLAAFRTYAEALVEWNARFNLTAITDPEGVQIKHFLDSLSCLSAMPRAGQVSVIDVGTGGGFPGLPLKIVCPQMRLTLVEATGKKVAFLEHAIAALKLEGVTAVKARAEEIGHDAACREKYDWAVARAVAEMPALMEYLLPLVKVGGHALAQKGESAHGEAHAAEKAMSLLGGRLHHILPVELPGVVETHYLVVVDKIAGTPGKYPRRPGKPQKNPLK